MKEEQQAWLKFDMNAFLDARSRTEYFKTKPNDHKHYDYKPPPRSDANRDKSKPCHHHEDWECKKSKEECRFGHFGKSGKERAAASASSSRRAPEPHHDSRKRGGRTSGRSRSRSRGGRKSGRGHY